MKLLVIAAAALAITACSAPAKAQSVTFRFSTEQHQDRYQQRREQEYRRFFRVQPSYYQNRCARRDVVVADPYTGRRVCMDRRDYREYRRSLNERYHYNR